MKELFRAGLWLCLVGTGCGNQQEVAKERTTAIIPTATDNMPEVVFDKSYETIHIFVALCDNKYQGIVPVPAVIGNGQNSSTNLYWGAIYGVKTFFNKSKEWKLVKAARCNGIKLERLIFKHTSKKYYVVADAYDGRQIKECIKDFISSSYGQLKDTAVVDKRVIGTAGNAKVLAYIGHDGLMDFQLSEKFKQVDSVRRSTIILACYSRKYFGPHLRNANVQPLLWTTGLMAPEAYTLHDALTGYTAHESADKIRDRAVAAYDKFQKLGADNTQKLLVAGWPN